MADELGLSPLVGPGVYQRGRDYWQRGRAEIHHYDEATGVVTGVVHGSAFGGYQVEVTFRRARNGALVRFDGDCSCPVGLDCKHAVALVLAALDGRARPLLTLVPDALEVPPWEQALALVRDARRPVAGTAPLALGFEVMFPADPAQTPRWHRDYGLSYLRVRPLTVGKQGRWIRSGAGWTDLVGPAADSRFRAEPLRLVRRILLLDSEFRFGYGDPWVRLDTMGSPAIWDVLADAVAVDLPLLDAATHRPVVLAGGASFELQLRRDEIGVVLTPQLTVGDQPAGSAPLLFLGDPAHGLAVGIPQLSADRSGPILQLARLAGPVPDTVVSLLKSGPVRIPVEDEPRFAAEYLLPLADLHLLVSPDQSYDIPQPEPPRLVCRVLAMPGHRVDLRWHWDYRRGAVSRAVPLDDRTEAAREPDQERLITAAVLAAVGVLPGLLTARRDELRPHAVTSGADSIRLVEEVLPALRAVDRVLVDVDGTLVDYRAAADAPVVTLAAATTASTDWFELAVTVSVDGEDVPFVDLFTALATGEPVFVLPSGTYFPLDAPDLTRLRDLIAEARALQDRPGALRISRYQADFWRELEEVGVPARQSERWLELVRRFRDDDADGALPAGLVATLRPYQQDGFRWLNLLRRNDLGGILADDMGLGKTVQTLAMIAAARAESPDAPPFLVVAPTSVVGNWQAEAARFTPGLRTAVVTATGARRVETLADLAAHVDVLISSYTLLRLEAADYQAIPFSGVVLDEAQAVKNHQAKAFAAIKRLDTRFSLAITGTPMENHLLELWALFSLVAPGLLGSPATFTEYYRTPIEKGGDAERLAQLRRRIAPFLLRRTKESVARDLPPKQEQILDVTLEPAHRTFYDRYLQRERQKVLGMLADLDGNRFAIFRSLMLLRQASIDPVLADPKSTAGSTKLTVLRDLIDEVVAGGHRALVFSQFTGFLARVRQQLDRDGIGYCYLDGATRRRPDVLRRFTDGSDPVFLISLKAGGVGLNLTEADYCILLDPWWNPATEAQAVDRAHRIGQRRTVLVYRLVARDTIEEKVMALKAGKAKLFDSVLGGSAGTGHGITAQDIRELLN